MRGRGPPAKVFFPPGDFSSIRFASSLPSLSLSRCVTYFVAHSLLIPARRKDKVPAKANIVEGMLSVNEDSLSICWQVGDGHPTNLEREQRSHFFTGHEKNDTSGIIEWRMEHCKRKRPEFYEWGRKCHFAHVKR